MRKIRNAANSLFVKVCLALLSLTFISWGASSAFVGNNQNEVITVNGAPIFLSEVQKEYAQQQGRVRQSLGDKLTPEIEKALGLGDAVVRNIVTEKVLEQEANRLELRASPKQMQDMILRDRNFMDSTGNFSKEVYTQNLGRVGFTVNAYENLLRRQILFGHLTSLFESHLDDPETLEKIENYARTTATLNVIKLNDSVVKNIKNPTAEEIAAYYAEHKNSFEEEETRTFTTLSVSAKDMLSFINISDADAQAEYEANKEDFKTGERRNVRHILLTSEKEALAVKARLDAGEDFTEVAKETSQDALSKSKGGNLGLMTYNEMISPVNDTTFSLEVGQISAPVKSAFGYHLVEVTEIQEPRTLTFDEAKDTIIGDLKQDRAEDLYYETLEKVESSIDAGKPLTDIAKELNLKTSTYTNVTVDDDKVVATSDLGALAFTLAENETSPAQDIEGSEAVAYVQTTQITPSRSKTMAEAQSEILADLQKTQVESALQEQATKLLDEVKTGTAFGTVARRNGLTIETIDDMTRDGTNAPEWLQRFHLSNIFRLDAGAVLMYPVTTDDGFALISLASYGQEKWTDNQKQAFENRLRADIGRDLLDEFAGHLTKNAKVEIKRTVLNNVLGSGLSN